MAERKVCLVEDCSGAPLGSGHCIGHAAEDEIDGVLRDLAGGRRVDVFRGTDVRQDLPGRLLEVLPNNADGRRRMTRAEFSGARFGFGVSFRDIVWDGHTTFADAEFVRGVLFERSVFTGQTAFGDAVFLGGARFDRAEFQDAAVFNAARFDGDARRSESVCDISWYEIARSLDGIPGNR